jgi:hypothetical protein
MSALSIAVKPRAREQGGFYRGYKPTPLDYQRANALGTPLPYGMWPDGKDVQSLSLTYRSKMDIVSISSIGRRLHVREDVKTEDIDSKWARVTGKGSDRVLRFVDKHISRAGKLLERMKTIAETARDDTLYESDRFALQMEMGRLQHDLNKESALVSGARSLIEEMPEKELVEYIENLYGSFDSSEAYKMLIRAEERLMNGEEWDIAETFTPVVKTFEENGDLFGYIDGFKWERTEDADVASVSEILKAKGRSVMDYKSAIVSAEEIDKDIERLIEDAPGSPLSRRRTKRARKLQAKNKRSCLFLSRVFKTSLKSFIGIWSRSSTGT